MAELRVRPDVGGGTRWWIWVLVVLAIIAAVWAIAH